MPGRMTDTTLAEYWRIIEVNQVGVFLGMKAVAGPMMAARSGSIIKAIIYLTHPELCPRLPAWERDSSRSST